MLRKLQPASPEDAVALAALHNAVADHLTQQHGHGPWSSRTTERSVLTAMRTSRIFLVRAGAEIVATFRFATKKPWAIDPSYFSARCKSLYVLSMAVTPARQRQGIGRWCLEQAKQVAREWPAEAIRLDAYAGDGGAGRFYARCGFREVGRVTYRKAPLIYYELLLQPSVTS